jgi:hypothetical protein
MGEASFLRLSQHLSELGGTGKSHLAVAIARACIRAGARGRFHTAVDLVNGLGRSSRFRVTLAGGSWIRTSGSAQEGGVILC